MVFKCMFGYIMDKTSVIVCDPSPSYTSCIPQQVQIFRLIFVTEPRGGNKNNGFLISKNFHQQQQVISRTSCAAAEHPARQNLDPKLEFVLQTLGTN